MISQACDLFPPFYRTCPGNSLFHYLEMLHMPQNLTDEYIHPSIAILLFSINIFTYFNIQTIPKDPQCASIHLVFQVSFYFL